MYLSGYSSKSEAVIDVITKLRKKISEKSMKIELDLNERISVLLPLTNFMLDAVFIGTLIIPDSLISM